MLNLQFNILSSCTSNTFILSQKFFSQYEWLFLKPLVMLHDLKDWRFSYFSSLFLTSYMISHISQYASYILLSIIRFMKLCVYIGYVFYCVRKIPKNTFLCLILIRTEQNKTKRMIQGKKDDKASSVWWYI